MNQHHRDVRKIDPSRGTTLGDNTPNDNDRVEIGPTQLAFGEWAAAGLELPDLQAMRHYRWQRLTRFINDRGYGGFWCLIRSISATQPTAPTCSCGTPIIRFARS